MRFHAKVCQISCNCHGLQSLKHLEIPNGISVMNKNTDFMTVYVCSINQQESSLSAAPLSTDDRVSHNLRDFIGMNGKVVNFVIVIKMNTWLVWKKIMVKFYWNPVVFSFMMKKADCKTPYQTGLSVEVPMASSLVFIQPLQANTLQTTKGYQR